MTDIDVQKRRFKIFIAIDVVMAVLVAGGLYAELVRGMAQARPAWVLALLVGFAAQVWFIMGFRKPKSEGGS